MKSMVLKLFLALCLFSSCTFLSKRKPCCSHLKEGTIKLTSVNPQYGGAYENAGYYHRLVIDNYSDGCIEGIILLSIAYHYIDTVTFDRPIRGVEFYDSAIPFEEAKKSGEDENHYKVANSLIIGFSFLTPYDSIEARNFDWMSFSRGGNYTFIPLGGIGLKKHSL